MAPIRRYLRISKYSVLECRIYLDNPALAQPWLLNPRNPVLPRVIESVRPLVLPKLREEKERSRKRSTKKRGIKDVVVEDDFEVSIFLTETNTRHSLVTKHKHFHDTTQTKLTSNSGRLVGASHDAPIDVDLRAAAAVPITLQEESDSEDVAKGLAAIPAAPAAADDADVTVAPGRRPKRVRTNTIGAEPDAHPQGAESDLEMVSSDDGVPGPWSPGHQPPTKRRKATAGADTEGGDKKKLALDISYEGFSIYGRVLCLVVKRRERPNASTTGGARGGSTRARQDASAGGGGGGGQGMMENFIISTQVPAGAEADAGPGPQGQAKLT